MLRKAKPGAFLMLLVALVMAASGYGVGAQRLAHDLEHLGLPSLVGDAQGSQSTAPRASADEEVTQRTVLEDAVMHACAQLQLPPLASTAGCPVVANTSVTPAGFSAPAGSKAATEPPFRPPRATLL